MNDIFGKTCWFLICLFLNTLKSTPKQNNSCTLSILIIAGLYQFYYAESG